jgi:hypothetical protein
MRFLERWGVLVSGVHNQEYEGDDVIDGPAPIQPLSTKCFLGLWIGSLPTALKPAYWDIENKRLG